MRQQSNLFQLSSGRQGVADKAGMYSHGGQILHMVLDRCATHGFNMDNFLLETQVRKNAFHTKYYIFCNNLVFYYPLPIP